MAPSHVTRFAALPTVVLATALVGLSGCSSCSWSGDTVSFSARADTVDDLRSAVVSHAAEVPASGPLRVRNLAGHVHLRHGDVDRVELDATVYARGRDAVETDELIDAMRWIEATDERGRRVLTLDYPVDRHPRLHYSTEGPGFTMTSTRGYDRKVTVSTQTELGAPTLYADIDVVYPRGANLSFFNVAGPVTGDRLEGTLAVRTVAGDVEISAHDGELMVDTGAGDITIAIASGSITLDTGSGDVAAGTLSGDVVVDTGSGDIEIASLEGEGTLDTGSGDVTIESANARRVRADTGSGEVLVRNGSIDVLHLDTGSGNIDVHGVDFETLHGDTGSGRITIVGSLARAREIHADTGSGDVTIVADPDASFDLRTSHGSGRTRLGYDNLSLQYDGRDVVGARRGDGRTRIHVDTGSGDLVLEPGR